MVAKLIFSVWVTSLLLMVSCDGVPSEEDADEAETETTAATAEVRDEILYGKWGGPLYSGPENAIDDLDSCCMTHDQCYDGFSTDINYLECNVKGSKLDCDRTLVQCLKDLSDDTSTWTTAPTSSADALAYKTKALAIFKACSEMKDILP